MQVIDDDESCATTRCTVRIRAADSQGYLHEEDPGVPADPGGREDEE